MTVCLLSAYQSLQTPKQIKGDLVWQEGIDEQRGCEPCRAPDEDLAFAVYVGDSTPQEQEAPKGERVRRQDPLQTGVGDVKIPANGREDDDHGLPGQALETRSCERLGEKRGGSRRESPQLTLRKLAPARVATSAMHRAFEKGSSGLGL